MYHLNGSNSREQLVTRENSAFVLASACYLELQELVEYCTKFILDGLKAESVYAILLQLDRLYPNANTSLKSSFDTQHRYHELLCQSYETLEMSVLSFVYQLLSAIGFESCCYYKSNPNKATMESVFPWKSAEYFVSGMPLPWIKKIMSFDMLCLESEFARYNALKCIFAYRDEMNEMKLEQESIKTLKESYSDDSGELDAQEDDEKDLSDATKVSYAKYFEGMLESVLPTRKKRKLDDLNGDAIVQNSKVVQKTEFYVPPNSAYRICEESKTEESVKRELFQNTITYTYMSFQELLKCKQDDIVLESTILSSFWEQAEMIHSIDSKKSISDFRFAVHFSSLSQLFADDHEKQLDKMVCSDPVYCAGTQYRVLLSREDAKNHKDEIRPVICLDDDVSQQSDPTEPCVRVLLQRTRSATNVESNQSSLCYSIYGFDRSSFMKGQLQRQRFTEPWTVCNSNGSGYANPIPSSLFQESKKRVKQSIDLWMMFVIKFTR